MNQILTDKKEDTYIANIHHSNIIYPRYDKKEALILQYDQYDNYGKT